MANIFGAYTLYMLKKLFNCYPNDKSIIWDQLQELKSFTILTHYFQFHWKRQKKKGRHLTNSNPRITKCNNTNVSKEEGLSCLLPTIYPARNVQPPFGQECREFEPLKSNQVRWSAGLGKRKRKRDGMEERNR